MKRHCKYVRQVILPDLRNIRGFAILLYSYLVVWFVVVFATTLLTISTLDIAHAQRTITTQQAFWAAEGELEGSMASLRSPSAPTLAVDACEDFGSRSLAADDAIRSSSVLCGTAETNTYRLEATGLSGSSTRALSTVITRSTPPLIEFNQVMLANWLTLEKIVTGSMVRPEDPLQPRTLSGSNIRDEYGDIGVRNTEYVTPLTPRITINAASGIKGNIYAAPGADFSKVVSFLDHPSQNQWVGTFKHLTEVPPWPSVQIPPNATPLGFSRLGSNERRCLPAGTYVTTQLILESGAVLCTTGTVTLYIGSSTSGGGGSNPDAPPADGGSFETFSETGIDGSGVQATDTAALRVGERAMAYGQPVGAAEFGGVYSPPNLRIFIKGGEVVLGSSSQSLAAAMVYAPDSQVTVPLEGTFFGAVIASAVSSSTLTHSRNGQMIFDQSLRGLKVPVGASSVQIKFWSSDD